MAEEESEVIYEQIFRSKNLLNILSKLTETDVTIIVKNFKKSCHKSVLAAQSPYFRAMFSSNMKESQQKDIILNEIDFLVLSSVIDYFYSSKIMLSEENIFDVIHVADFLQVASIHPLCDRFLCRIIKPTNCITIHLLAARYNYNDVSTKAFQCVLKNFSTVYKEEDFLEAPFDFVSKVFDSRVLQVDSDDQLCNALRYWINYDIESRHKYIHQFKVLDITRIASWFPLHVDEYFINCGIVDKDLTLSYYSKKFCNSSWNGYLKETKSKVKSPLEICFVIGGYTFDDDADCVPLCSVEALYNRDKWEFIRPSSLTKADPTALKTETDSFASMTHCRSFAAVACSDKLIYVMGGNDGSRPVDYVECYDPITNKWESLPPLPYTLDGAAAAYVNGKIFITGGYNHNIGINNKVWSYEEGCKSWRESVPMLYKRSHHGLVAVHGALYAIGGSGEDGNALSSVECFFIGLDCWIEAAPLTVPRSHLACVLHKDTIYAVCGKNSVTLDSIERYEVLSNRWWLFRLANKVLGCKYGHGVSMLHGRLLIIGGKNSVMKATEAVYNINLDGCNSLWYQTNHLIRSRVGFATVTMKIF